MPPMATRLPEVATRRVKHGGLGMVYPFFRPLHGLMLGAGVLLLILSIFEGRGHGTAAAKPREKMGVQTKVFSRQWMQKYSQDDLGCGMGRGIYTWRGSGFGSNINIMLNAWVYALAVEGWSDLALIIGDNQLRELECSSESNGLVSHGWSCLFSSMPHLCVFNTPEMWQRHMNSSGLSQEDEKETEWFAAGSIARWDFSTPLALLDIDQLDAKAVMAKFLWSKMTPWLRQDVDQVTHTRGTFEKSPFIAIHIRRGDKIRQNADLWQDAETYLAAASNYLEDEPTRTPANEIKGIWVASDNTTVVDEVRALAHMYFPSVTSKNIVYIAGGVPGMVQIPEVTTVSMRQAYGSFVYLMADFEQMAAADVFVGTFSSNMGKLVMLLREGIGKERTSCISLDKGWGPNRQRSLVVD